MSDKRSQWVELANALGNCAYGILSDAPVTTTEKRLADPRALAIMLLSRTLSHFNGTFVLIDHGLVVEARILVRCCFENAFWIAGLLAEGDAFVQKMLHDEARSRRTRGELALNGGANAEAEQRLREQLRLISEKWPKAKSLNPKEVAFSGLLKDGYLIYSQLSADAAHPSVTSLNRYVGKSDTKGEALIEVVPALNQDEVVTTWDWACNSVIGACVGTNQILGGTKAGEQLRELADRYQALTKRD